MRLAGSLITVACTGHSFVSNRAENGSAAHAKGCTQNDRHGIKTDQTVSCQQADRMSIRFYSIVINRNVHRFFTSSATLYIQNIERFELHSSTIIDNNGSAIYISGSKLYVSGRINVAGNRGHSGGGLYSDCNPQSYIILQHPSQLYMANNAASYHGGAIFVKDCSSVHSLNCFIQIEGLYRSSDTNNYRVPDDVSVILENNTAEVAGKSIYGGLLETCYLEYNSIIYNVSVTFSSTNFTIFQVFKINNGGHSMSEVTSDPFQVCF